MDVVTSLTVTISTSKVYTIPLKAEGSIRKGLSVLLIGRSSTTMQGIIVHPGVVDADFTGQIHAMVSTTTPSMTIPEKNQNCSSYPF